MMKNPNRIEDASLRNTSRQSPLPVPIGGSPVPQSHSDAGIFTTIFPDPASTLAIGARILAMRPTAAGTPPSSQVSSNRPVEKRGRRRETQAMHYAFDGRDCDISATNAFLAGHKAPAGIYREVDSGRLVRLESEDILPATFDGRVGVYIRVALTWSEHFHLRLAPPPTDRSA